MSTFDALRSYDRVVFAFRLSSGFILYNETFSAKQVIVITFFYSSSYHIGSNIFAHAVCKWNIVLIVDTNSQHSAVRAYCESIKKSPVHMSWKASLTQLDDQCARVAIVPRSFFTRYNCLTTMRLYTN